MSFFNVTLDGNRSHWTEQSVQGKLLNLGNLKGKEVAWIRSDLSVNPSNSLTRLFWTCVAKHFEWMRKIFYQVDLESSRSLLQQIGEQIEDAPKLVPLFNKAVLKFNQIAEGHKLQTAVTEKIESINARANLSWKKHGFKTGEQVTEFAKQYGEHIQSLNLKGIKGVNDKVVDSLIGYCPNLSYLKINAVIGDQALINLRQLKSLEVLNLRGCKGITDVSLKNLHQLPLLKELNLSWCGKISDIGLASIKELKDIVRLELFACPLISDKGLGHLKGSSLRSLNLGKCHLITDRGLKRVGKIVTLQGLNLTHCPKIIGTGFKYLTGLSELQELMIPENCKDEGIKFLRGLKNLKALHLNECKGISNLGLQRIAKMTNLIELYIIHNDNFSDSGVQQLKELSNLKTLYLMFCSQVSDEAIKNLQQALPELRISNF